MATITAIEQQTRDCHRYNLYLDGKYLTSINENTLFKQKLHEGQELTPQQIERLRRLARKDKLLEIAFRYLEYRPRSKKELEQHLRKKLYQKKHLFQTDEDQVSLIEEVLDELGKLKLLDDLAFGKWWIEQRRKGRSVKGKWAIRSELIQKGLPRELIDKLVDSLEDAQEEELALETIRRRYGRKLSQLPTKSLRGKALKLLVRRGFSYEIAKHAVDQLIKEG